MMTPLNALVQTPNGRMAVVTYDRSRLAHRTEYIGCVHTQPTYTPNPPENVAIIAYIHDVLDDGTYKFKRANNYDC